MRQKIMPISGSLLMEKANLFTKEMNINFMCTLSCISRFKTRHNIVKGKISGETAIVDKTTVTDWLSTVWPNLRDRFFADDIFNTDETGQFYKMMPDKTLKFNGETCGEKMSKDRLTLMVAASMSGTIKRKLLVIGKSKKPRCFKVYKSLPVD
ncbi:tigger transposable element-derived protein 4-like [Leptopilina boulardi]|uniref:tigger transposable element-derived protein 4-like n=1 Tax=Leptopilina boulardi TaxID=63433 RepID=UPI0021F5FD24|nr:tigger transposable element-derived protein 4-like [Leptopilina boulardi]